MRILRWGGEALLLIVCLHTFVFNLSMVSGTSMQPSIEDGDVIFVDRMALSLGSELARGDVIVMRSPRDPAVDYVKRVIGLPGERVELVGGDVFIDGLKLDEPFGVPMAGHYVSEVPPNHLFVLGDNRARSSDSRDFGVVPTADVKGKVRFCFWPPRGLRGLPNP